MFQGTVFQNGYVCADIEAAVAAFRARGQVRIIGPFDAELMLATARGPARQVTRLAFVWQGGFQHELIQPVIDEAGLYGSDPLEGRGAGGGGLFAFHHAAMRVDDWDAFRAAVDAQELPVAVERAVEGDALKFLYLDAREICGHYLEYVWMTDERWAQLGGPQA
ncbi:MAG: VOC family protein [Novosphingobium meiothermophilum]